MEDIKNISDSIIVTLKEGEFNDISLEIIETVGDSFLSDGILKELPVLGSIIGITKGILSIQDKLFVKKLCKFFTAISHTTKEERSEQIDKIQSSEDYKIKVGEKLLYIIDRSEDSAKAEIAGKLFAAYLKKLLLTRIF